MKLLKDDSSEHILSADSTYLPAYGTSILRISFLTGLQECSFQL